MRTITSLPCAIVAIGFCLQANATPIFSDPLTNWALSLNNGVAYITSPQLPANCAPARAEIKMSGAEYDKALFTYVLNAKDRNETIRIVVDDTLARCIVMGVQTH